MTETANIHGTDGRYLTEVLPDIPSGLTKMRSAAGYDTPIGHRCTNILEMLDAGTAKTADIATQVRELAELTK